MICIWKTNQDKDIVQTVRWRFGCTLTVSYNKFYFENESEINYILLKKCCVKILSHSDKFFINFEYIKVSTYFYERAASSPHFFKNWPLWKICIVYTIYMPYIKGGRTNIDEKTIRMTIWLIIVWILYILSYISSISIWTERAKASSLWLGLSFSPLFC